MMTASKSSYHDLVVRDADMRKHTSWRAGGLADIFFRPHTRQQLIEFLAELDNNTPILWLGLGSNLLVRDGGYRGVVIATQSALVKLENCNYGEVYVEAGVPCAKVARYCSRWNYGEAHFFAGIPGTIGGALAMNAGAFGGETWNHVIKVETINRQGEIAYLDPSDFEVSYRSVKSAREEWFLAAHFAFQETHENTPSKIKELLAKRKATQPMGLPSCGSVFRNPPGDYAARLIEAVGLKGCRVGGAVVSTKHANFIINYDQASAHDIETLMSLIRDKVYDQYDVELIPEVKIVGEPA